MQILWLVVDVVIGIVVAGAVAPLALAALPGQARGPTVLAIVAIACILVVSLVRRTAVGTRRARR